MDYYEYNEYNQSAVENAKLKIENGG